MHYLELIPPPLLLLLLPHLLHAVSAPSPSRLRIYLLPYPVIPPQSILNYFSVMAHTSLRDFTSSAHYATIEACLHLGPRNTRNSGATSSMTFVDEDEQQDDSGFKPRDTRGEFMSEAEHQAADWYGIAEDTSAVKRPGTWC